MTKRRIIIAAIGGDKQRDNFPCELGAAVARAGCILLTGGGPSDVAEVKNLAQKGAVDAEAAEGIIARLIGVIDSGKSSERSGPALPSLSPDFRPNDRHRLIFNSGLPHNIRNVINGVVPDAVVAFGGGPGTLAEIAFAAAAQRPIFFHAALGRLRANFERDFGQSPHAEVEKFLTRPLRQFPSIKGKRWSSGELIDLLSETLARGEDAREDAASLVARCQQSVDARATLLPTGFSDLRGDEETIRAFERVVTAMS